MNVTSRSAQIRALRIRILQESLKWLRGPGEDLPLREYRVCLAILLAHNALLPNARSQWGRDMLRHAVDGLIRTIEERLVGNDSVCTWVMHKVTSDVHALTAHELARFTNSHPDMIAYRRAWVEDMIRTLQNGGDL